MTTEMVALAVSLVSLLAACGSVAVAWTAARRDRHERLNDYMAARIALWEAEDRRARDDAAWCARRALADGTIEVDE